MVNLADSIYSQITASHSLICANYRKVGVGFVTFSYTMNRKEWTSIAILIVS